MKKTFAFASLSLLFALTACDQLMPSQQPQTPQRLQLAGQPPAAADPAPAQAAAPGSAALMSPETLAEKAPEVYKARFATTKGDFVVEVHRDWAPQGADRFYNLVNRTGGGCLIGRGEFVRVFFGEFGLKGFPFLFFGLFYLF